MVDIYILIRYSMFLATNCETHKILQLALVPATWRGLGGAAAARAERRTGVQGVVLVEFDEIEAHISSSLVWTEISLI